MFILYYLFLISFKTVSFTDTCYYPLELNNVSCDKKEVKYYKKNPADSVGFIRIIYQPYSDTISLIHMTKGINWHKNQTTKTILNLIILNKIKYIQDCNIVETFIKIDLLNNKITYVNDYYSYEKLKIEYWHFKKPVNIKTYYKLN